MDERRDRTIETEEAVLRENRPRLRHLFRLWKYVFASAPGMCLVFMGLTVLLSLLRPVLAFLWGKYVDSADSYGGGEGLLLILGLAFGYYIIHFLTELLDRYLYSRETIERLDIVQANRFQEKLNARIYRKLGSLRAEYNEIPRINDLTARVFDFLEDGWKGLNGSIMTPGYFLIAKLVSIVSVAASLYILNPWLCLILLLAPVPTLYTTYIGSRLRFAFVKDHVKLKREADYFQELMLGGAIREIRVLTLLDFFYEKWKSRIDEYTVKENRNYLRKMGLDAVGNIITAGAGVAGAIMAIVLMTRGYISPGALSAVLLLITTLLDDTGVFFSSLATFLSKKNEAAMFFDLMDLPEEREGEAAPEELSEIRFRDVSYRYPLTDRYVLRHINVAIRKGEKVALVGENGAGKTTFVGLINGILRPSEGKLEINGRDTEETGIHSRYASVACVSQEPAKYLTFSVSDNVFLGDTGKPRREEDIRAALDFAGLEDLSGGLLLGKETGGTDLSGGQWQKLAIARSRYRNRDFMILDEPTGNLDPLAETEVLTKYMEMAGDKTVIMVTHRISAASLADRILVFHDGAIVEDGPHEKLLAEGGWYAQLYHTQAKWYQR